MRTRLDEDDPIIAARRRFDAIAACYETVGYARPPAERLVELAGCAEGQSVLDLGAGTGHAARSAASRIGPHGRVVAADLSSAMIVAGRALARGAVAAPIEWIRADAEALPFADETFDAVLASESLAFVPNMLRALRECARVLRPTGSMAFTTFGPTFMQPLRDLWAARLAAHGIPAPRLPYYRLEDPTVCRKLLHDCGFTGIDIRVERLPYRLADPPGRWVDIACGLEGAPLDALDPAHVSGIRAEHLEEIAPLFRTAGPRGVVANLPLTLALAWKRS